MDSVRRLYIRGLFKLISILKNHRDNLVTLRVADGCKKIGILPDIEYPISTLGLSCFSIGDKFNVRKDCKIRAYQEFASQKYNPEIVIGNNFYIGTHSNILIIGKLYIGNNVTLASRVTIIDHSHGRLDEFDIDIPVMQRILYSKGAINISDNVWIGEGAIILGGISIGKNSVIAANAVVTKNIPPNTVVGGVPARRIRTISNSF